MLSVSSHNTTSTHLPVTPALLHPLPKLAMVPPDACFLRFLEGEEDHVFAWSQHATSPALSLIKSYWPHVHVTHCVTTACVFIYKYMCLCVSNYERCFPVHFLPLIYELKGVIVGGPLRPNESICCSHVNIYFACSFQFIQDITMKHTINKLRKYPILLVF